MSHLHLVRANTKEIVTDVLATMKKNGFISDKAQFDYDSIVREQVVYSDWDFMSCLSRFHEDQVVDYALEYLKQKGVVDLGSAYDKNAFVDLRQTVKGNKGKNKNLQTGRVTSFVDGKFSVPWTTISPVMERLLYMLSSVRKPKTIMAFGIYCGASLVWTAGPTLGKTVTYEADKIYGIDKDMSSIKIARNNFGNLSGTDHVHLFAEDGIAFAERMDETCDYLYLDADKVYLDILQKMYHKLRPGAWVLAHDVTHRYYHKQYSDYLEFVRDKRNFATSICFDFDLYGFELSIR